MQIYRAAPTCYALAHSVNHEDTPEWRVIHWMAKMHVASRDKLLNSVSGTSSATLAKLSRCNPPILISESGVENGYI